MKVVRYLSSFAIVMLVLSVGAFAKDDHSGGFTLFETVRVGSTELGPGQYKAQWTGTANDVKINILRDGKTVATTQGTIKNLGQPSPYDAVTTKTLQDNSKALDEIDFNKKSDALVLAGE
jgi:major membrane immunogen (membrane-anchored lipoprotein)